MGVRLEPADEYTHELGPEPNFNESMYINLFDPAQRLGGFFRLGNRANEGYAEMTVCLYLPDGRVGFMYKRPTITDNDALDAGGLTWEVVTPFEELTVRYEGKVVMLDDPTEMADPKAAFTDNPYDECEVELTFLGQGRPSMFGGEPDRPHEARARSSPRATTSSWSRARAASASATRSGRSRGAACATTPGGPGPGRRRGTTGG